MRVVIIRSSLSGKSTKIIFFDKGQKDMFRQRANKILSSAFSVFENLGTDNPMAQIAQKFHPDSYRDLNTRK